MAFDEGLAQRVRDRLGERPDVTEKKMFGGIGFLASGNMLVGVLGDELVCRVGPDGMEDALARPGACIFDFSGRPMSGWVLVAEDAVREDGELAAWIDTADRFVATLPPK